VIPRSLGLLLDAIVGQAPDDESGLLSRQYLFFWKATQSFSIASLIGIGAALTIALINSKRPAAARYRELILAFVDQVRERVPDSSPSHWARRALERSWPRIHPMLTPGL
jgi:hypothetical protein